MSTSTSTDMTADEMFESMTGYDEKAVTEAFGAPIATLARNDELQMVRALVFVDKRRQGVKGRHALEAAQALTIAEVDNYFAKDADPMPDDPTTDSGKGDSSPESEPES